MTFIVALVYKMINQKVQLVEEDYYEQSLTYSDRLTAQHNATNLANAQLKASQSQGVVLSLPYQKTVKGQLKFYNIANPNADFAVPFTIAKKQAFLYQNPKLKGAKWNISALWNISGAPFELNTTLNP